MVKSIFSITVLVFTLQSFLSQGFELPSRLDGAIYYRFNSKSFRNFIIQKTGQDYKVLALIPDFFFNIFGSSIRNYLNRNNKKLLKYSDVIVFQSKMSKAMHEYFWGKINKKNLIIYNGIKSREYSKKTINKEINLVITASFRLNKRLSDAILITNSLNLKNYTVKLHVIGKLDFLTIESIANLDKSNSIFHGHLNFKSIQKITSGSFSLTEFSISSLTDGIDSVGNVLVRISPDDEDEEILTNPQTGEEYSRQFTGQGADCDIIVASARAYLGAINRKEDYKLRKQELLERTVSRGTKAAMA